MHWTNTPPKSPLRRRQIKMLHKWKHPNDADVAAKRMLLVHLKILLRAVESFDKKTWQLRTDYENKVIVEIENAVKDMIRHETEPWKD